MIKRCKNKHHNNLPYSKILTLTIKYPTSSYYCCIMLGFFYSDKLYL